jgi:hypothetical protein
VYFGSSSCRLPEIFRLALHFMVCRPFVQCAHSKLCYVKTACILKSPYTYWSSGYTVVLFPVDCETFAALQFKLEDDILYSDANEVSQKSVYNMVT